MMLQFVPNLSTQAGSCLTMANWQEVGVSCVAYDLVALLVKPGMDVLYQYDSLADYVGWQHQVVLNAAALTINQEGKCHIRSHFNGEKCVFDWQDIVDFIKHLAVDYLLLPKVTPKNYLPFLQKSLAKTAVFLSIKADIDWFEYPEWQAYTQDFDETQALSPRLRYVLCAEKSLAWMQQCVTQPLLIESNQPAEDALNGILYTQQGNVSLKSDTQRTVFDVIDKQCKCPTCQQHLTRAYLSHLYTQTPLLCQRFLIQHNVFQACHLPGREISL